MNIAKIKDTATKAIVGLFALAGLSACNLDNDKPATFLTPAAGSTVIPDANTGKILEIGARTLIEITLTNPGTKYRDQGVGGEATIFSTPSYPEKCYNQQTSGHFKETADAFIVRESVFSNIGTTKDRQHHRVEHTYGALKGTIVTVIEVPGSKIIPTGGNAIREATQYNNCEFVEYGKNGIGLPRQGEIRPESLNVPIIMDIQRPGQSSPVRYQIIFTTSTDMRQGTVKRVDQQSSLGPHTPEATLGWFQNKGLALQAA